MKIDKRHKIEKIIENKKGHRPVFQHAYLRDTGAGWQIEATDGYKAVIVPIAADDIGPDDTEGFVSIDALKRAAKNDGFVSAGEDTIVASGLSEPRPCPGNPVKLSQIFTGAPYVQDAGAAEFTVGLNAKLLYELAQGLGSDVVELRLVDQCRPIGVLPAGKVQETNSAYGLIMPVDLSR